MKNTELADKLKQLRKTKGYSQEEVARKAQLSLRTVQRIENGETEPRGDTLYRLAKVLDFIPEDLLSKKDTSASLIAILHLSSLSFFFTLFLGLSFPHLYGCLKKMKIKSLTKQVRKCSISRLPGVCCCHLFT